MGCGVLPALPFVPAQRAIGSDSLAHRARKPSQLISKGPTGRRFAVKGHHSESNCRPVGPSTSGCYRFQGRWPWLFELLALWAETKNQAPKHGVVPGRVLSQTVSNTEIKAVLSPLRPVAGPSEQPSRPASEFTQMAQSLREWHCRCWLDNPPHSD